MQATGILAGGIGGLAAGVKAVLGDKEQEPPEQAPAKPEPDE
jgi:hypothetical protein